MPTTTTTSTTPIYTYPPARPPRNDLKSLPPTSTPRLPRTLDRLRAVGASKPAVIHCSAFYLFYAFVVTVTTTRGILRRGTATDHLQSRARDIRPENPSTPRAGSHYILRTHLNVLCSTSAADVLE